MFLNKTLNFLTIPFFLIFSFVFTSFSAVAQEKFALSGTIKDGQTGETLLGATIYVPTLETGTITNTYGFYSLTLPANQKIKIVISFVGYNTLEKEFTLTKDEKFNIELNPSSKNLKQVVIEGDTYKEEIKSTQMSVTKVTAKEAKNIPAIFGEVDIIKTLQLKPGVQSGGEGTAGLYIRGGGADQNLIVLDEATVYNANHLFGFFSTFNSDAVKNVELYKGGFPAKYGGRLSSVVDVTMRDGNRKKFSGTGGLGIIASRLTLEGPIQKDKSSFIISGRRTYADIFTRQINKANEDKENFNPIPDYFFYDLNSKLNFDLGEKDKLFLSGYFGRDVFGFSDGNFDFGFDWGNATGTARWNHIFSSKLFVNTSFIFSDYRYKISNKFDIFKFEIGSSIQDINLKTDFYYQPNNEHTIKFGGSVTRHNFSVGRLKAESQDGTIDFEAGDDLKGTQFGIYGSDDIIVNNRLKLNVGLRLSGFARKNKSYFNIEPRLAANYSLKENISLKASYARMAQYVHLIANSGASLPTDLWYPSTENVQPQISDQVALGISFLLWDDQFLLSNEVYYKWLQNQIDLKDNANIFVNNDLEGEFVYGKGWAYGNEIFLEKKSGNTTGWIGYTLSWAWREFGPSNGNKAINNGEKFNPTYDRRHDISVVIMQKINKKLSVTGTWVYGSGAPTTLPNGFFLLQDVGGTIIQPVPDVDKRSNFRYAAYHRMDLGLVWKFEPKWGEADLTLSVYNAYDRRNPFFIYFEEGEDPNGNRNFEFKAKQVSLFPILPSITYNFKF